MGTTFAQSKKSSANSAKAARARTDSIAKARKVAAKNLAKARKHKLDSTTAARTRKMDSAKAARKFRTDSITAVRTARADSIAKVRKKRTDSLSAIRKRKTSKKYKDSVARARQAKTDSLKEIRTARMDSITAARRHVTDSITAERKERTDSIRTIQKHRTDSLAKVKKYKSSKRYTDSVTLTRRHRSDSIKAVQKDYRDSIASIRKHVMDSIKLVRTKKLDSTKAARTKFMDSIKLVRKHRMDSLTKKKETKEKVAKANEKKKQEALKMKFELKLKQKREEWSNTSMLKKKWGPVRRLTQNSFTHYNYYFNANRKMEEAEMNMRRVNRENYDSLIGLFPFDPNKDSSLLASDMDSIVHKVSVGIQIHDPRIKWSDDMYLLLGQAYYYKGSYENASIAFRYILSNTKKSKKKKRGPHSYNGSIRSKEGPSIVEKKKKSKLRFLQHKSVHNDAILWLARTYTTAGQIENGESILSLLEYDANLPDNLLGRLAVEKAFAYLEDKNYPEASKQLSIAVLDNNLPEWLRLRIAFLNGQLLMQSGSYGAAAESFEEVLVHFPKIEMDFYTRKYIAYNKLMAGNDIADAMTPLKKLLKDNKYAKYYDQVYYFLGQLAAKANKNDEAITFLTKSTTTPKATKKQKALSFAAMGDVYYATSKYAYAKIAYDSAAKYSSSAAKDVNVASAVQRSSGLKEIAGPTDKIHEIDSLLALGARSKKDQQSIVRHHLRNLEKQLQDSIRRAENAAVASLVAVEPEPGKVDATSWYFANPTLIAQGSSDFKRKWGTRPLTDNWRRAAAAPLAGGSKAANSTETEEEEEEGSTRITRQENGLPTEAALLAVIPNTAQQKALLIKQQQHAYIDLAKAYIKQLDDYPQALASLDALVKKYPDHGEQEEELFLRYKIAVKQGQLDKAQEYSAALLKKFPKTKFASLLQSNQSESKPVNERTTEVSAYFDETYELLMRHQYTEALMRSELGKTKFDHPVYAKRFEVVSAMAYAGSGNYDMADSAISKFIKANPSDSLTDWATAVKKHVKDMRENGKPSWWHEGMASSTKTKEEKEKEKAKEEKAAPKPDVPATPPEPQIPNYYVYRADTTHYFMVVLPGLDSRTGPLKKAIRKFDSSKFGEARLDPIIDLLSMTQSTLLVKSFKDATEAKSYMNAIISSEVFEEYEPGEISTYVISSYNYLKLFGDKRTDAYLPFYNMYYNK